MKHILLFILYFFATFVCQSTFVFADDNKPEKNKVYIVLEGETEDDKERNVITPIDAYIICKTLYVESYDAITDATLTISGPTGIVETRTVSFTVSQTEIFNLDLCNEGFYTLTITTPRGTYLYGYFTL